MSSDSLHCERCGAVLAAPEAVCEQCERDLAVTDAKPDPAIGKYRCPECACKFDKPNGFHERARSWHLPDKGEIKCPHCGCLLRERTLIADMLIRLLISLLILVVFISTGFVKNNLRKLLAIILSFLYFGLIIFQLYLHRYYARSEQRYVAAKRQKPSKQQNSPTR
jgi:hypothetical protein